MTSSTLDKKVFKILERIETNTAVWPKLLGRLDPRERKSVANHPFGSSPIHGSIKKALSGVRGAAGPVKTSGATRFGTAIRSTTTAPASPRSVESPIANLEPTPAILSGIDRRGAVARPKKRNPTATRDAKGRFIAKAKPDTTKKAVEARASAREKSESKRFGNLITGAIRTGFGTVAGNMMAAGQNNDGKDIVGTAAAGPVWSAAREVMEAVGNTRENRFAKAVMAKLVKKGDAGSGPDKNADGRRGAQGRFVRGSIGSRSDPEQIEIAQQNLENVKDVKTAIADSDKNADRRNKQVIKALLLSGRNGGGGSDGGGILDWLFGGDKKNKKGPKGKNVKGPKGALSKLLNVGKKGGGAILTALTSGLGFGGAGASAAGGAAAGTGAAAGGGLLATMGGGIAAGGGGYLIGTLINKAIGKVTGGGEGWLGNWLYDKVHPKAQAPEPQRYTIAENGSATALRNTVKEVSPDAGRKGKAASPPAPQVIVQPVPIPAPRDTQGWPVDRGPIQQPYHIPTQFDDTTLMLLALDRI